MDFIKGFFKIIVILIIVSFLGGLWVGMKWCNQSGYDLMQKSFKTMNISRADMKKLDSDVFGISLDSNTSK